MSDSFDLIVIGTGQGGVPLAKAFAKSGRRVAIIERSLVGGTCVNNGCTPSKTLAHVAKVADTVRRAGEYGVISCGPEIDMAKVQDLRRSIVEDFREGTQASLEHTPNLELIFGSAKFLDCRTVEVGDRRLCGATIVIDTGGRPSTPSIEGLDSVAYLDSTSVMELDRVPKSVAVLGGGYIGLEFGQMLRRFGAEVTIIEREKRFLHTEDQDVADEVLKILHEDGIRFVLGASVVSFQQDGESVQIGLDSGEVTTERLLVAAGRTPNTEDLNLSAAGIEADERGYIKVDPTLETTAEGVYAIGDVNGGPAFTHISYDDYRVLKTNLLDGGHRVTTDRFVPYTVFIDPQLGRIGLSEDQARQKGIAFRVAKMPMSDVARATEMKETRGFVKALVGEDRKILGAAVLGVDGGEVMSMIEIAMMGGLTAGDLQRAVLAHPTVAELLNNLFG